MRIFRRFISDLTRPDLILVTVLSVMVTAPFGRILVDYHFLYQVAGAAVVALMVSAALGRKPLVLPLVVAAAGLAGYMILEVFKAGPSQTWTGVTSTWSDLLTATTPAVASPSNIAAPVLLGWAATLIGCLLALRTRLSPGPLVAPLVVLVVALAYAGTQHPGSVLFPAALVVVILAILLTRAQEPGRGGRGGTRRIVSAASVFGGATVIALAIGIAAPAGSAQSRFDLRAHYNPPLNLSQQITPLAQVTSSDQVNPANPGASTTPVFTVKFSGIPSGQSIGLIPIAYLESYDGAVWSVTAPFSLAGPDLPPGPAVASPTATIDQTYTLSGYPNAFLPALEGARVIKGQTLGFDRTTGTLVDPSGAGASITYSVSSAVPQISTAAEQQARPGVDPSVATLVLPPANEPWPSAFSDFASEYGTGSTPLARLDNMVAVMRSSAFGYNTDSRPGHSLGVLADFLGNRKADNYHVGDSEQFAAAFAVLARIEGFPSRVVVGYRLPTPVASGDTQPVTVLTDQMYAWTEVNLNGVGWVTFDPTNPVTRKAIDTKQPPPPPVPVTSPATVPSHAAAGSTATNKAKSHKASSSSLIILLVALIVGIPALIVAAKKLRKRLRRERGDSCQQILGAWKEARDRMRERNIKVPKAATALELAELFNQRDLADLGDRINALGPLVDRALYAPEPPEDSDVEAAWEAEAGVEDALKAGSDPSSRLRGAVALVDPRTLVGSIWRH